MKIHTTFEEAGINTKGRVSGNIKVTCPQCPPDRGNPKDPSLSVDLDKKVWMCHYCGFKGGLMNGETYKPKTFKKPEFNATTPTDKMAAWFKDKRGIDRATLEKFLICPTEKYIGKTGKKENCIAFPYVKNTEIVNVKSRFDYMEDGKPKKTFTLESECELCFYNIDSIREPDHCIIVEGEIDALTVWQATQLPVVSVPNGASKGDVKLEYLDNGYGHFENKKIIVIATDSDEPGQLLKEELARRLGKDRCYTVEFPEGCKDFNEVLLKHGPDKVEEILNDLKPFPIEGIITVASVQEELNHIYEFGYPKGDKVGFDNFDKLLAFRGGEVTTLTGVPGHGKTEFLDEVLERLSRLHNWRHGLFAAENGSATLHYTRLAHRYIGKPYYSPFQKMSPEEKYAADLWMNDHFFFINQKKVRLTVDSLLEKGRELVLRFGIKSFVIDPYNCMESQRPGNMSETEYVSFIYSRLVDFAETNNAHVFLVAHPTKMKKAGEGNNYEVPTLYSISGSANFFNKTFNGIAVHRNYEDNTTDVYVQKVKFDFIGQIGFSTFQFDKNIRRYTEI